jgi:hypothetical protein
MECGWNADIMRLVIMDGISVLSGWNADGISEWMISVDGNIGWNV